MRASWRRITEKAGWLLPVLCAALPILGLEGIGLASEGGHEAHLNWWDFFLRVLNVGILVVVLFKLAKKPVGDFFTSRREEIRDMLADLESKKKEAEAKNAEYRAKLGELEIETRKIVDELIAEGEAEKAKIIASAEKQAEYIRQQARIAIQQEVKAAREHLQEEIGDLSVAAAEEILRKNLQPNDQDRLIRDFMTRVVEAK